jgi:hypothetical protein
MRGSCVDCAGEFLWRSGSRLCRAGSFLLWVPPPARRTRGRARAEARGRRPRQVLRGLGRDGVRRASCDPRDDAREIGVPIFSRHAGIGAAERVAGDPIRRSGAVVRSAGTRSRRPDCPRQRVADVHRQWPAPVECPLWSAQQASQRRARLDGLLAGASVTQVLGLGVGIR